MPLLREAWSQAGRDLAPCIGQYPRPFAQEYNMQQFHGRNVIEIVTTWVAGRKLQLPRCSCPDMTSCMLMLADMSRCLCTLVDMAPVQTLLMEDMPPGELHQLLHANDLLNAALQRWQALLALGVDDLADPSGDLLAISDTSMSVCCMSSAIQALTSRCFWQYDLACAHQSGYKSCRPCILPLEG